MSTLTRLQLDQLRSEFHLPARACLVCGNDFLPRGTRQKYCNGCQPGVHRIQVRNRMRRLRAKRAAIAARNAPVHARNEQVRQLRHEMPWDAVADYRRRQERQTVRKLNGLD